MSKIIAENINEAWLKLIDHIRYEGHDSNPRGSSSKEVINASVKINNPRQRILDLPIRGISLPFAFGELVWYLSGRNDVEMMEYYSKAMGKFSDDNVTLNSAYGYRIFGNHPQLPFDQWKFIIDKLKEDPDSRQAIIHLHTPNNQPTKDEVCTLTLQFLIRDNKLHMIVNMRSNDVIWGFTYDVFSFTFIQELIANELGVELGTYEHNAGSMHIYEKDYKYLEITDDIYNELLYMTKYSTNFPLNGMTLHDENMKFIIAFEKSMRLNVDFNDFSIDSLSHLNDSVVSMASVFNIYKTYKKFGVDAAIDKLDYDNIFHCMMRQYLVRKKPSQYNLLTIIEGVDGAGKTTFIDAQCGKSQIMPIRYKRPEEGFNKMVYFHTVLLDGQHMLDRFFYSELVYGSHFEREPLISGDDLHMLESLLNYRQANIIFFEIDPMKAFSRLDHIDKEAFSLDNIKSLSELYELRYRLTNVRDKYKLLSQ